MLQQTGTLVHELAEPFLAPDGHQYDVRVYGIQRKDGTWIGWLEFDNPLLARLSTDRETTQSKFDDISYWAKGLEPIYLEGAFARAHL